MSAVKTPDPAAFVRRRRALLAHMNAHGGGVAVIATASEKMRNRDTPYAYRPDSYFHYLSGFGESEAVLVLIADAQPRSILFCRAKDPLRERWEGARFGPEAAAQAFAFDEAFDIATLGQRLPVWLAGMTQLWCAFGYEDEASAWPQIASALASVRRQARSGTATPNCLHDIRAVLDEMRLIKDEDEIALMRRAAQISAEAHRRAMQASRAGRFEYEIEATLLHHFRHCGASAPAYGSIVAGGANACVLHYTANDCPLQDGDLLLIDAGCELEGYASDITRTFPVNGRFSAPQRALYDIVLAMQQAARAAIQPGAHFDQPHEAAVAVLIDGLIALGILPHDHATAVEQKSWQRFYPHRTSHWLGRDVHDAGAYHLHGQPRPLLPGMVLTIEPGCYILPADDVDPAFWNIGIRIEDDALVTAQGCEYLSADVPTDAAEIEALMRSAAPNARGTSS